MSSPRPLGRHLLIILLSLLLASLACQAASQAFPSATPTPLGLQANPRQYRVFPTPTATIPPATATPSATPSPTSTPVPTANITPSPVQLRVFNELWETVRDDYLYADYNGLDWEETYADTYSQIVGGLSDTEFYLAMDSMLALLGDDHSIFLNPQEAQDEEAEFSGENDFVGIGILTNTVPERARVTIIAVFPDSPADRAGLRPHDSILEVDGQPVFDGEQFRRELLHGPSGSTIQLTVLTPGSSPRLVELTRSQISGSVPVDTSLLHTPGGRRIGYLSLPTFADETIGDQVGSAIKAFARNVPLDGLILDLRQNSGGADTVARQVLSYFTDGLVGYFIDRDDNSRSLRVFGTDEHNSSELPLVVLIGPETASFGEIFAGVLQDLGRARLVGEKTGGNVELLWGYDFEDGSLAWIAREKFRPRNHPEHDWEKTGILPDIEVYSAWDEITLDTDPVIQAALVTFDP